MSAETKTIKPRTIHIQGTLQPGSHAEAFTVNWRQELTFSNYNRVQGADATTEQKTTGTSSSIHDEQDFFTNDFEFYLSLSGKGQNYTLENSYRQRLSFGSTVSPIVKEPQTQTVYMNQHGTAESIVKDNTLAGGWGSTRTSYSYQDSDGFTFKRDNSVRNQSVIVDEISGTLAQKAYSVK